MQQGEEDVAAEEARRGKTRGIERMFDWRNDTYSVNILTLFPVAWYYVIGRGNELRRNQIHLQARESGLAAHKSLTLVSLIFIPS